MLRGSIAIQIKEGLHRRGATFWVDNSISYEEKARAILEVDWEIAHGYSYRTEAIDGFDARNPWPWVGDRIREAAMKIRIFWRKTILRQRNPYLKAIL